MPERHIVSPGEMLGVYKLTELIGTGGFSEVWSAWDTRLNRLVALKIMPLQEDSAANVIQFQREATLVTKLEHPHILPLYDFGETSNLRYLVMRYITGGSLLERINQERLAVPEIVRLMLIVAEVLDYIHGMHIVHRDLKPANILLDAQNAPYLTDFGLAKALTDETRPMHSVAGTLTFMPPEQLNGGLLSHKSDLYSFGLMLYMLFAGRLPYDGRVAFGMRQVTTQERLPDVTHFNVELPMQLNMYLWQLTDPDSAKRPDNALSVMKPMAELLRHMMGSPTPLGMPESEPVPLALDLLESKAYRQREAESLLRVSLPAWENKQFAMSLTHYVLLDMLLREMSELIIENAASLMLRAAIQYDQHTEYWWSAASEAARQRACWHALDTFDLGEEPDPAVGLRALKLINSTQWIVQAAPAIRSKVGHYLLPESDLTEPALTFLEKTFSAQETWQQHLDDPFTEIDDNLYSLARGQSKLAERAAILVGKNQRIRVVSKLAQEPGQAGPLLTVYEAAGSLPPGLPRWQQVMLVLRLARRQLTRKPLQALAEYGWAAAGCVAALALMIFVSFRASSLFNSPQLLNTFALGVSYGLVYGIGVWLARHIAQRLKMAPYWQRALLGLIAGGMVMALGFISFQQLVYSDVLSSTVALGSGLLFVAGFALSVDVPAVLQVLLGAAGTAAALIIPFALYLQTILDEVQIRPPFIFDDTDPQTALLQAAVLAIAAALVLATLTLKPRWWGWLRQRLKKPVQVLTKESAVAPKM